MQLWALASVLPICSIWYGGSLVSQIDQFFAPDGSLISIPAKNSKKIEVLNRIAEKFAPGVMYTEKELNEIISDFHDDTAALRRYMIEFGIMQRNSESVSWLSETP
jgi:hypothetical protein